MRPETAVREWPLVLRVHLGAGAQGPAVDGLQADAPQALGGFGVAADTAGPHVQVVVGLSLRLLGVLLTEQARGRLQRAQPKATQTAWGSAEGAVVAVSGIWVRTRR